MRRILFISIPIFALLGSCSNDPVFPVEPRVEYLDIQPREVVHTKDSILITFRFQDGDGNIGGDEAGQDYHLLLIDSRLNNGLTEAQATTQFVLPSLTPDTRNPSIQGEMTVKLDFTANLSGQTNEQVRYQIKLIDRDGNVAKPIDESGDNIVWTDFITVRR